LTRWRQGYRAFPDTEHGDGDRSRLLGSALRRQSPDSTARVPQHLDVGQGEVNWTESFAGLRELDFDGVVTVCVFAWETRARRRTSCSSE
jgi:sugar phosphate isomerase/epimerase